MLVPGWTAADYRNFWETPDSLSDSDQAIWEGFGLSAEELGIDWNSLFDEQAYYDNQHFFRVGVASAEFDEHGVIQSVAGNIKKHAQHVGSGDIQPFVQGQVLQQV
mgnify:CR=1 FL=1